MKLIEARRLKAGDMGHREIACTVRVTATDGTQIRDVLHGVVYGAEAQRDTFSGLAELTPDGPNLLVAFKSAMPTNSFRFGELRGRYFDVAADSIAVIYREEGDPDD